MADSLFLAFEDQPSWRFRKFKDEQQDNESKEDLKTNGKSPRDRIWIQEREAEVEPVAEANTASNQDPFNHNELTASVRLETFKLPSWDGRRVQSIAKVI